MKCLIFYLVALATGVGWGAANDLAPTYSLGIPPVTPIRDTTDVNANEWLAHNAFHVAMSSCFTNGADAISTLDRDRPGVTNQYRLVSAQVGFSWERLRPDYYLSDRITPPDNVDWRASYERFQSDYPSDTGDVSGFLFNVDKDVDPCVYAANGGVHVINWVLKDGTVRSETYVIGAVAQGRPKRIYWTDSPYNSPKISLVGKFVRFFGMEALVNPRTATVKTVVGGQEVEQQNVIVEGLYLDKNSMVLEARGKLTGQVLMVYYDSGNYDSILCVQVLEVCQPDVIVNSATVGSAVRPDGRGYGEVGLTARVTAGIGVTADDRGDYFYQHAGQHSYSPKHNQVFAIRPTYGERWKAEIYWMETDPMGVQWPFEVDQYELSWPDDIQRYVRGDLNGDYGAPIRIPEGYTAELQKFQEPNGHAKDIGAEGRFMTIGDGKSLLKLTGDDNVWFLPIESVMRSNKAYYTLAPSRVNVGLELEPRSGTRSGVAPGVQFNVTGEVPGYIYQPGTPNGNYDANLYSETNAASSVYAVSTNGDIEVWWSERWKPADLPVAISVPALPQVYRPIWPETDEAPQIVIASQQGSANETIFAHHGAAYLDAGTNATLHLPGRVYFPQGEGTLMFWTRASHYNDHPGSEPAAGRLFTLGRSGDSSLLTAEVVPGGKMRVGGADVLTCCCTNSARENAWVHFAFVLSNGVATVFMDGVEQGAVGLSPADDWTKPLTGNTFGSRDPNDTAPQGREFAEITMVRRPLSAAEAGEWRYKLRSGDEAELTGYFSFRSGEDLDVVFQQADIDARVFRDRVTGGTACLAVNVAYVSPGAPMKGSAVVSADATPTLYCQNDPAAPGYNPNDEHAIISTGAGGYVAYALRCDLATEDTPPPAVFVEYQADGKNRLQFYHVLLTNETWKTLSAPCLAGMTLPGPRPLIDMPDPWLGEDYWEKDGDRPGLAYRDRKKQIWARAAGDVRIHMYYAMQEGFCFPSLSTQPAPGTAIPWLACLDNPRMDPVKSSPAAWTWHISWPENVHTMKIGQTLTTAADMLPEMWNARSMAVVYPDPGDEADKVVILSDPTVIQSIPFPPSDAIYQFLPKDAYAWLQYFGLSIDPNGGLTLKSGKYRFTDLPPSLSKRLYVDATNKKLCLMGERVEKNAGATILYPNVLSAAERRAVEGLARAQPDLWKNVVKDLVTATPVIPNRNEVRNAEILTTYGAVDHYALTAMGGTNYVVVIENDATEKTMALDERGKPLACSVKAGDPISMHVFKVVPEYYTGRIVTREDEVNLLSQQLSVLYTDPIGGNADGFEFEWKHAEPNADGTIPENYESGYVARPVSTACGEVVGSSATAGVGLTRFVVGQQGDTLANMVNTYWICRYRAVAGSPARETMGEKWSDWCAPPALAEGWVQRVLNNVTPFNQRMTDLYENKAETTVSMIQQAGAPFTGDVALNQDNLTSVGLIQLYETILNKAETLSIANYGGEATIGVAKQLQLAVERLGDLYKVLGDEAYSDAKNPTIGFGENLGTVMNETTVDFASEASSLFCFDNQVNSLLDEELCLLRGRSGVSAPTTHMGPYYNRLLWNFTKGITAGEVAYAVNYNVSGTETVALSEEQAARVYPQGHGDAYGHYLSALKGWYRLLRNPNFAWFRPSQTEMNIADSAVNVDYYEEAKFAEAAADLAKTAADVVDLSARKAWRDNGENGSGYLDTNTDNAFGFGEWASRGGYGALVNWAVANSILPEDCTIEAARPESASYQDAAYQDKGLTRIDRGTVDELKDICESAAAIMRAVDRIDSGLNPLGLSERAIPFDIAPGGVEDGTSTHFEQVRDRAKTALANARKVLERAQTQAGRMRMIAETTESYEESIASDEGALNNELIGYYGKPYSDDIGPGKTYKQGYDGPDLIHYMWMDLEKYGITELEDTVSRKVWYYSDLGNFNLKWYEHITAIGNAFNRDLENMKTEEEDVFCEVSGSGIILKPTSISGRRLTQGTIQEKYGELLIAYAAAKKAIVSFNEAIGNFESARSYSGFIAGMYMTELLAKEAASIAAVKTDYTTAGIEMALNALDWAKAESGVTDEISTALPDTLGAGMTVVTSPRSLAYAANIVANSTLDLSVAQTRYLLKNALITDNVILNEFDHIKDQLIAGVNYHAELKEMVQGLKDHAQKVNEACFAVKEAVTALNGCVESVNSEVAKAEAVLARRENARKRQVSRLSQLRYNEMLFRKLRDKSLSRYSAAFDLAQKYVYMAAQVYDYETALKREESGSGDAFKAKVITTRALGAFDSDGEPMVADDGDLGLSGYLAQMDANWQVMKPRLGINNPQPYTTWFSLRGEKFRILDGAEGDKAWAKELNKHWVDDILTDSEFKRHCQPFQSQFGLKEKEPGLIIPFETTIDFAKNFFGNDLAGGDHAYDSTWYSTRIAAAGVWFDGYNAKTADAGSSVKPQLAETPVVYLVPVGYDCLRAPGLADGTYWQFSVVDQVIAAPYNIGSYELDNDMWMPSMNDADWEGGDATVKIRKHPSFRAYFDPAGGAPSDVRLDATRLVGRSVWNTRWILVIPAGAMNADREKALSVFINGQDSNRDGKLDLKPVSDIKIGFRTYSQSGN